MASPVKIGQLSYGGVWLTVFSSVPPSREVIGSSDGLTLSLTVFGDDPHEPIESSELIGKGLVEVVDRFLVSNGEGLGLAIEQHEEKLEWEAEEKRLS